MKFLLTGTMFSILIFQGCKEKKKIDETSNRSSDISVKSSSDEGFGRTAQVGAVFPSIFEGDRLNSDFDFIPVADQPLSTVSIDVDKASFTLTRKLIKTSGEIDKQNIRIEEFINYFRYKYQIPSDESPLSIDYEDISSPWDTKRRLARIGIQAKKVTANESASIGRNLIFLIDVSGSMDSPDKLPLLKASMKTLTKSLQAKDSISIVTYGSNSNVLLEGGKITDLDRINSIISELGATGGTNGADGINTAYKLANEYFIAGGVNRVILATDGDFNIGVVDPNELTKLAKSHSYNSIYLTVLGFGGSSQGDLIMESFSNKADGTYFFIDSEEEAQRVLTTEINSALVTVAKDVKVQIEFNPRIVSEYRLIGYNNRILNEDDFDDDDVDAGDISSEQQVTYLYEYLPNEGNTAFSSNYEVNEDISPLIYQSNGVLNESANANESMLVNIRYKNPQGGESKQLEQRLTPSNVNFSNASANSKFAVAAAAFSAKLSGADTLSMNFDIIKSWAQTAMEDGSISNGNDLIELIDLSSDYKDF